MNRNQLWRFLGGSSSILHNTRTDMHLGLRNRTKNWSIWRTRKFPLLMVFCLLHSSLLLTLTSCVSYLVVHMAEHGCQLLLNFTCYNLDRQGEINIRLPVPDLARVSCPLWDCGQKCGHVAGIWQSLLSLWMGGGRVSLRKQMKVNNSACGHWVVWAWDEPMPL